jgi:hypothetical protein
MKKSKKQESTPQPGQGTILGTYQYAYGTKLQPWAYFFQRQKYPMLRSQLITALQAGTPLEIESLPEPLLLDAALFARACRSHFDAEVVDDYQGLLNRIDAAWKAWKLEIDEEHKPKFDSPHRDAVSAAIWFGSDEFTTPETQYIPALVDEYLSVDEPPKFFDKVVTK